MSILSHHYTPRRAIRKYCLECASGVAEAKDCQGDKLIDGACVFYPNRTGRGRPSVKTIRRMCRYCMNGHLPLVKTCANEKCYLHPYRMGKNPACAGRPGRFKSEKVACGEAVLSQEAILEAETIGSLS